MILEQDSWSPAPSGIFLSSSDSNSNKNVSSLVSDGAQKCGFKSNTDSDRSDICENDAIFSENIAAVDDSTFSDPLYGATQSSNNVFEMSEEKNSSDFLYYGWPELGCFDDVDRMFRNCEKTFGIGTSKEKKLNWLPAANDVGNSGVVLQSDFEFPLLEPHMLEDTSDNLDSSKSYSVNDSAAAPIMFHGSSWPDKKSESYMSVVTMNGPATVDSKEELNPKDLEHMTTDLINPKPMELSHASCYLQSDSNPSLHPSNVEGNQKKVHRQNGQRTMLYKNRPRGNTGAVLETSSFDTDLEGKFLFSGGKFENHLAVEGVNPVIPAAIGTSNKCTSSTLSFDFDEKSPETASFINLLRVMEQLDLKTKLCIRDSLYRLAHSAEQRHNHANSNGICRDESVAGRASVAYGINRHPGFIDTETDTNPIDRTIAHLLFHRPIDSTANRDSASVKSPRMVHGPSLFSPVIVDNSVREKTSSDIES